MARKSWLCGSALKHQLHDKAEKTGADVVLFDLEDSVAPHEKQSAREALVSSFKSPFRMCSAIRINPVNSLNGIKDLVFILEKRVRPDIVVIPKARLPYDVTFVASLFSESGFEPSVFAIVESSSTLWDLRRLVEKPAHLSGLIFGAADFSADLGIDLNSTDFSLVKLEIATTARHLKIDSIDSPCFSIKSPNKLNQEISQAKLLGFSGKIAVHPSQVESINLGFSPTKKDIARAESIVKVLSPPHSVIAKVEDEMFGPPFKRYAQVLLSKAKGDSLIALQEDDA